MTTYSIGMRCDKKYNIWRKDEFILHDSNPDVIPRASYWLVVAVAKSFKRAEAIILRARETGIIEQAEK